MPIRINEIEKKNGERFVQIRNGHCFLEAPLDYGPRIMRFGFHEDHNVLATDLNIKEKNGWEMRGGHRLWHSPEHYPRTYNPDNKPVELKIKESGFILTQPVEELTNVSKSIEIIMDQEFSRVKLIHKICNSGLWDISLSAWAITVMLPGGVELIPLNPDDTGLLPNRSIVLWPGTNINDSRLLWKQDYLLIRHDNNKKIIKLGFNNRKGIAAYYNRNSLFIKKYAHEAEAEYPDFGSSYETYLFHEMLEMESLSPVRRLRIGDAVSHTEEWELVSLDLSVDDFADGAKIDNIFCKYNFGDGR